MIPWIKIRTFLFCILGCFPANTHSNVSEPTTRQEKFDFNLDYAGFRYEKNQIYLEIYLSFSKNQFQEVQLDSQNVVLFGIDVRIYQNDSLKYHRQWNGKHLISDTTVQNRELITMNNFILPASDYRLVALLSDLSSEMQRRKEVKLSLSAYSDDHLAISDIELAYSIVRDSTKNSYTKNRYKVMPNPGVVYDINRPILYFYSEIYNLSFNLDTTYTVEYCIINSQEEIIKSFPEKTRPVQGASLVEVGGLNVITLPTGTYFLELNVTDLGNSSKAVKRKKFYIYKDKLSEKLTPTKVSEAKSDPLLEYYKNISEKALEQEFESAKYIATKKERKLFKSLDLEGKRTYLAQFWSKGDIKTEIKRNEYRERYLARVKFTNNQFSGISKGWKTDRGRVFIIYGNPDEVERNPSIGATRGYEVWQYFTSTEMPLIFVFVDKRDLQDFELVHSTARGEIHDPDWRRWINVR